MPIVGTIYRAVTGDQIPEAVRRIGSIIMGALTGGPIGALINIGIIAAEKITGIDIDKTGQMLLAGNGAADHKVATPAAAPAQGAPLPAAPPAAAPAAAPAAKLAQSWSPAQLAAYGVTTAVDGTLKLAGLSGADVLNSLELSRLQVAQVAYGQAASLAS